MTEDKTLKELYAKQRNIKLQIRKRKREIAKKTGDVVDSIDDLVCEKHPEAKFKHRGEIPNSHNYNGEPGSYVPLYIYQCETCEKDIKMKPLEFSRAYDCPNCGVVLGDFVGGAYRSNPEDWSMFRRMGRDYTCRICRTELGHHYWET